MNIPAHHSMVRTEVRRNWLFSGELQDPVANGRRNPELGVRFQLVQQRFQLRDQSRALCLEQDAKHPDGLDAQLNRDAVPPAFVHEEGVGVNFERQRERGGFTQVKAGSVNGSRNGEHLLPANPDRQCQTVKARGLGCQPVKFSRDFQRDDNLVEETGEEIHLADAAQVQQDRCVGHDDHRGNNVLSAARSSSSICSVQMGMLRSPKAR